MRARLLWMLDSTVCVCVCDAHGRIGEFEITPTCRSPYSRPLLTNATPLSHLLAQVFWCKFFGARLSFRQAADRSNRSLIEIVVFAQSKPLCRNNKRAPPYQPIKRLVLAVCCLAPVYCRALGRLLDFITAHRDIYLITASSRSIWRYITLL